MQHSDLPHVTLVGHSMGGLVARGVFLEDGYVEDSVRNVVTLATPHLAPPAYVDDRTFDYYDRVNSYWKAQARAGA